MQYAAASTRPVNTSVEDLWAVYDAYYADLVETYAKG
jgi:hypothetical protein